MSAGLFGKIPAKGDFVQHGGNRPVAKDLDRWLREGVEALRQANQSQPASVVRFVFSAGSEEALVGTMAASRDQVGREFPLAVFAYVPAEKFANRFPLLPIAYDSFLERASELVSTSSDRAFDALASAVGYLQEPGDAELGQADGLCQQALASSPVHELHNRLFDTLSDGTHYYAYQTFLTACNDVRNGPPDKGGIILDCPISVDVDLFAWLELANRHLHWKRGLPSFFWIEDPEPRLLLCLGPPSPQILGLLANRTLDNPRLWPLRTSRAAAIDAARSSLSSRLDGFGDGTNATLGQLIEVLGRA